MAAVKSNPQLCLLFWSRKLLYYELNCYTQPSVKKMDIKYIQNISIYISVLYNIFFRETLFMQQ